MSADHSPNAQVLSIWAIGSCSFICRAQLTVARCRSSGGVGRVSYRVTVVEP